MLTGTSDYQGMFQNLLHEVFLVDGQNYIVPVIKLSGDSLTPITVLNSLIPSAYDFVDLTYTGDNLTQAVFKQGGSGGTTVVTLTMTYTGSNLKTVTRS